LRAIHALTSQLMQSALLNAGRRSAARFGINLAISIASKGSWILRLDERTSLEANIRWCDRTAAGRGAGSTFLCQLLAQHPDVHCEGFSSPLCNILFGIRRMVSDDSFLLSQLDTSFETSYAHLAAAMKGFLRDWHHNASGALVVDKNRAWLHAIELLLRIEPEARLIVCIRELGQIYGSVEAQHQRTILVDFVHHLADYDRFGRTDMLFAKDKVIGAPLISLHAAPDLPKQVKERLYFVHFEDLMEKPAACLSHLSAWLGLSPTDLNLDALPAGPQESERHYRMKFLHRQTTQLVRPVRHEISARIQLRIETAYAWY
jgi:sulfotransferase